MSLPRDTDVFISIQGSFVGAMVQERLKEQGAAKSVQREGD